MDFWRAPGRHLRKRPCNDLTRPCKWSDLTTDIRDEVSALQILPDIVHNHIELIHVSCTSHAMSSCCVRHGDKYNLSRLGHSLG